MSGHYDRTTSPRVSLPPASISLLERRRFIFRHPIAFIETRKGAKLLDMHVSGWQRQIDIGTLRISNDDTCILAQLFGSFSKGAAQLKLSDFFDFYDHGFCCRSQMDSLYRKAWEIQIQDRR